MSATASSSRALVDHVIAAFRAAEVSLAAGPLGAEDLGALARLRETFLAAGVEALERRHAPDRWLQVGLCLADAPSDADALLLALAPTLDAMRAAGAFRRCFFMRKPPGIRLRFCGEDVERRVLPELRARLAREPCAGLLTGLELGAYDAETHLFGGVTGMELAHDFFDADTRTLVDLVAIETGGGACSNRETLSLVILNDLIGRLTLDTGERWDVWRNMDLTGRLPSVTPEGRRALLGVLEEQRGLLTDTVFRPESALAGASDAERALVDRALASNRAIAQALSTAAQTGQLVYGPRRLLPFWIIFHWNRWGLGIETQRALTFFMEALLDPAPARSAQ